MMDKTNVVNVRWHDGYHEVFECTEVRFGCDLLWMQLTDGSNRHIPLRSVRTFSLSNVDRFRNNDTKGVPKDGGFAN